MINIKKISIALVFCLGLVSCTDDFANINSEFSGVGDEQIRADFVGLVNPLKLAQQNFIYSTDFMYQLQVGLNADLYSGFFATANGGFGQNNSNYFMRDWNDWIMKNQLEEAMQRAVDFHNIKLKLYPNIDFSGSESVLSILKVMSSARVSDAHGPVIYSHFGKPNADFSIDYDSQQDAYKFFIKDLSDAIQNLQKNLGVEDKTVLTKSDITFGGNPLKWAKLANSIKLRLAMRMAYADPVSSKKYAEEALSSPVGLIDDNADNALISYGNQSPVYVVCIAWGDANAGAPLTSFLNGYKDPRLKSYIVPATDQTVNGQYIGVRQGIDLGSNKDKYGGFSHNTAEAATGNYLSNTDGKAKVFTAAEAWFLRAEAALRGYSGAGDAKTNYEKGVQVSFIEWGKSAGYSTYIDDNTSLPQEYIDPKNNGNNILTGNPILSTATIKWDNNSSFEMKLERVITQKWLALYPDGVEAWAEQRRTGYPKLFPNVINNSGGTISTQDFIRRIPIPAKYRNNNAPGYEKAAATLGGPDTGGTKLWWDKK